MSSVKRVGLCVLVVTGLVAGMVTRPTAQAGGSVLLGAWEVIEVVSPGAAPTTEPGVFIFTANHYSAVFVASARPRLAPAELTTPADFRAVWGGPFTAQAGRYSIESGSELVVVPIAAKNPTNMGPGSQARWQFQIRAGILSITEPSGRIVRMKRAG